MGLFHRLLQWFRRTPLIHCDTSVDNEPNAWQSLLPRAQAAVAFWSVFLDLRIGDNDDPIDSAGQAKLVRFMRALSWTESRHGTGSGVQPTVDPCQCGNPGDPWWKEITGQTTQSDYLQKGPANGSGYYASALGSATEAAAGIPVPDWCLSQLNDQTTGHNDANFNADTSFYWAVPIFLHKMNKISAGRRTSECADLTDADAIAGAKAYNGNGDPVCHDQMFQAVLASMTTRHTTSYAPIKPLTRTDIQGAVPSWLDFDTDPAAGVKSRFYNLISGKYSRLTKISDSQSSEETGDWSGHPVTGDVIHLEESPDSNGHWKTDNEMDQPAPTALTLPSDVE